MNVELRIERLVLDGVELNRRERAALRAAVERELRLGIDRRRPSHVVAGDGRVDRVAKSIATAVQTSLPRTSRK